MEFHAYRSSSAANLYALRSGDHVLGLEAGVTWADLRRAFGFRTRRLDGVLVTHAHADHARCVPDLARHAIDVYAPAESFAALGLTNHRCRPVQPLQEFDVGAWRVLPFAVRHDAPAVGYFVRAPHDRGRLLFTVDTAYVPYRFDGMTHVAIECNWVEEELRASVVHDAQKARVRQTHMSAERVATMLQANDLSRVKEIWLLHMSDRHGDAEAARSIVREATGKPVFVAEATAAASIREGQWPTGVGAWGT